MPGLLQRGAQFGNGPSPAPGSLGIWSRHRDEITFDQLQKFWNDLPVQARQNLLRIDKQTLFEQARKNLYCSRCNGLLLEGFSQIVMYGKSLQLEGEGIYTTKITGSFTTHIDSEEDDAQDPSVHPWGGLATTRDGILTILDGFINAKSLKALQNCAPIRTRTRAISKNGIATPQVGVVFDNARSRERERELLYPDACGGGGRGWISQGLASYSRGHGARETCALHTARLSCDTLVDFWSAFSDETRLSLLRMKEEDFIERLMYRFDSKRFCRDCRRNVIREFKELKELKRMRREPRCTSWFCVADTAFQYEVLEDAVEADWHQSFTDTVGRYHHFEWAIGTGERKSDILDFEDVGMNGKVQVNGLDLGGLSACFITLRAWKHDGRCTELCVKAHALKGQPCVHRRLIVGDGFVTITKGENIRRFFEHAEEAEEEEDDDAMDKDGNEFDGDGSRPQKHAKSPELAREFLLDAATVIFKEQVEKAFREGTARQNAHSIFVCLALKLLEERIHVACKEIITLEKQIKLLEEEEREKREEEERKERRRTKEREKKLRRKERLKGKERDRERKQTESGSHQFDLPASINDLSTSTHDDSPNTIDSGDSISELGDTVVLTISACPDTTNGRSLDECINANNLKKSPKHQYPIDIEFSTDGNGSFLLEQSKSSRRKLRFKKDSPVDPASKWCISGTHRPARERVVKTNARNCNVKFSEKFHCSNSRVRGRYEFQSCSCNHQGDHRPKDGYHSSTIRSGREIKVTNKAESSLDKPRPIFRSTKYNHGCHTSDSCTITRGKPVAGAPSRDVVHTKQVWEPMDMRKKFPRNNSDPDITLKNGTKIGSREEVGLDNDDNGCDQSHYASVLSVDRHSSEVSGNSRKPNVLSSSKVLEDSRKNSNISDPSTVKAGHSASLSGCGSKDDIDEEANACPMVVGLHTNSICHNILSSSSSDNCSSCLSEGDNGTSSSSARNPESSSTSDSEDASQHSDGRYAPACNGDDFHAFPDDSSDNKTSEDISFTSTNNVSPAAICIGSKYSGDEAKNAVCSSGNGRTGIEMASPQQHIPLVHNQSMHGPIFSSPSFGYHTQNAASWSAAASNRLVPFPQPSHYVFPCPFGYGLAASQPSEFHVQYNALQPLPSPVLSSRQLSSYHTANTIFVADTKEQIKNTNALGVQQLNGPSELIRSVHPPERQCSNSLPSKQPSAGQNGSVGNAAKSINDAPSFSLFHFGGPLAGAGGYNGNTVSRKEVNAGGLVPDLPAVQVNADCSKEEKIEEYSLFASSTGARFSFF